HHYVGAAGDDLRLTVVAVQQRQRFAQRFGRKIFHECSPPMTRSITPNAVTATPRKLQTRKEFKKKFGRQCTMHSATDARKKLLFSRQKSFTTRAVKCSLV